MIFSAKHMTVNAKQGKILTEKRFLHIFLFLSEKNKKDKYRKIQENLPYLSGQLTALPYRSFLFCFFNPRHEVGAYFCRRHLFI